MRKKFRCPIVPGVEKSIKQILKNGDSVELRVLSRWLEDAGYGDAVFRRRLSRRQRERRWGRESTHGAQS
jgi:hypothetical protein